MHIRKKSVCAVAQIFGGLALVGFGGAAIAQQAQDTQQLQRVEITGSSIKRVDAETALPVTIIKREDIERTGATTAQDLVNLIPSNFGGTVVATNVGSTGNASTANLRALGSKYTLVLLNGRRVANYAFGNSPVDLNSIPVSAIERIEVLRDGASAVYGADAIAGVINFILKKDYQGLEASVFTTIVDQGGGETRSLNFTGGFGDLNKDRYNVFLSANRENNDSLKAKDRSFASTAVRPDLGINKSSPRNGIPNLNFTDTLGNKYVEVNPLRYTGCNSPEFGLAIIDAKKCGTDYVKFIDLIPKASHQNVVGRFVFQLNQSTELYAEAANTKDHLVSTYSPAPYTIAKISYPANGRWYPKTITIPKGYTTDAPYTLADGTILPKGTVLQNDIVVTPTGPIGGSWRTSAGGGRTDITDSKNGRYLAGAKGTLATWDYDSAFTYSKNEGVILFGPGKFSYERLTPLVNSGEINVFGPQDAKSLAALQGALLTGPQQSATSTSKEFDVRVSKELFQLANGPLGFAVGTSFRNEDLAQKSFPVLETGDEVGGNGPVPSVTGSRKVFGLFSEFNIPVLKALELQVAGRYDKYKNSFGTSFSKFSPKLALRYQPIKELVLRSSYGTGYRAPTLYENLRPFSSGNNTNANWSDPIRCPGGVAVDSVNAVGALQDECSVQLNTALAGSKDLKPETSKQFSLGAAFSLASNFNGSVDYWDVRIKNAIVAKSEIQVFSDPVKYKDSFYRYDPKKFPQGWVDDGFQTGAIQGSTNPDFPLAYVFLPFENTATIFGAGIDLNLNFKQKLNDVGTLGVNLDSTLFTKHGYQYKGVATESDLGKYKDFGPSPRWRHALTFTYGSGPWNASLTHNYTAGYEDYTDLTAEFGPDYPLVRKVRAYQTYDFQGVLKATKDFEVGLGIKNLFNQDPPSSRTSVNFQTGYDAQYTNPLGRTYYIKARYKFL
jgi:iron complex outermembrane recepter protein